MRRSLLVLAVSLALTGCGGSPAVVTAAKPADAKHVERWVELKPGLSSIQDAEAIMGAPTATAHLDNGNTAFSWSELTADEHMLSVNLLFDPNGKFIRELMKTRT